MNRTCTWEGCTSVAVQEWRGKNGRLWADLCGAHNEAMNAALRSNIKVMLSQWVRASGGAKKLTESM